MLNCLLSITVSARAGGAVHGCSGGGERISLLRESRGSCSGASVGWCGTAASMGSKCRRHCTSWGTVLGFWGQHFTSCSADAWVRPTLCRLTPTASSAPARRTRLRQLSPESLFWLCAGDALYLPNSTWHALYGDAVEAGGPPSITVTFFLPAQPGSPA